MGLIEQMDDQLSNKIAAGEVVERPASVVKELVENAIDAGSTQIEIRLEEAGLRSIRVIDNGCGMDTEDAKKAFARHATSKVRHEYDLFRIATLGFRGEALASIASVSKVTMMTSNGTVGTKIVLHGGIEQTFEPFSLRQGTDFIVEQLFYNTPARLKHMKSLQTELSHSIDLVNRLAFSYPSIAFTLVHDGKTVLETTGRGDLLRNIASIYGVHVAKKMIPFEANNQDYAISGYVSLPELTRANRNYVTTLVNHRWIKNYAIQRAMTEAMHTFLPIGRYPIIVMHIEADPQLTDVNVHPSKQQIRIGKEGDLLTLIETTIRQTVQRHVTIPAAVPPKRSVIEQPSSEQRTLWDVPPSLPRVQERTVPLREERQPSFPTFEEEGDLRAQSIQHPPMKEEQSVPPFPTLEVVGQVHGTYIVAQNEDGFYMIDQHAAQERIKYEYFRDRLGDATGDERQLLLIPLIFHYASSDIQKIEERRPLLERAGIFLEPFGPTSYTVREYPIWFPEHEVEETIEAIIEQVLRTREVNILKIREEAAIMMSCKRSIKANHYLTKEHMEQLLRDLSEAEHPYTCPHGRPVLIHFTTYEIEKMFKRIM